MAIARYNPAEIEKKWQEKWEKEGLYKTDLSKANKLYVLAEFAYPSGDLHLGHWFTFGGADIYARFKRMQGFQVFYPNGFDAFGLPAENAAIKRGIHPQDWTLSNIKRMKEQYGSMGASFTFDHEVITCLPEYYRWNQWIFLKMFEKGLVYRGKQLSNWCETDQTVLANEGVENGTCWRCHNPVVLKEVEQWFFKITAYADKLLWPEKPGVDWPKAVRDAQNEWIGESEGVYLKFDLEHDKEYIEVFTTALDTVYGVGFMVLAPEHPLVAKITTSDQKDKVKEYIKGSQRKSELERTSLEKEKTGVFTGAYCINPFNNKKVPIWAADYVLMTYGTGAVMGVPGHDARDHEFAKKYGLEIKIVVKPSQDAKGAKVQPDGFWDYQEIKKYKNKSILFDSGQFDGMTSGESKKKMEEYIEIHKFGQRTINYHLHDWSISRQRYWGTPVPIIHCENCGMVPVPLEDLPVELPYEVDYTPKGKPPLASNEKWLNVNCSKCGGKAQRDAETMDTFVDSSWYFFRYLDSKLSTAPFDKKLADKILPVDIYFGGAEHTLGHTLYSRFFTKFFHDIGLTRLEEYANRRINHGNVLGPDGYRMSKSRGNVVNPDEEVKKYGADTIRIYLAFFMPYEGTGPWISDRVFGVYRFLKRVWELADRCDPELARLAARQVSGSNSAGDEMPKQVRHDSMERLRMMHKTIRKVTVDIETINFNTAIAALMEWLNFLTKQESVSVKEYETFLKLLAPFAPHMTEELYQESGIRNQESGSENHNSKFIIHNSIHVQSWPQFDPKLLVEDEVTIVVQVNGKVRDTIKVKSQKSKVKSKMEEEAKRSDKVKRHLEGAQIKKVVYVEGRILNFVV